MISDLLNDSKCVHIKINKEIHLALRALAFKHGITMQDLFGECASQLSSGSKIGMAIIDSTLKNKLNSMLEKHARGTKRFKGLGRLDNDSLYSLINSGKDDI